MLMKDRIHRLTVSIYYLVLKVMKKYLNPEEVASTASQQAKAGKIYQKGKEMAGSAPQQAQDSLASGHS